MFWRCSWAVVKNQDQNANKSEFCSCQETNSVLHVVIYTDYRVPLNNQRFWSWMFKSIYMDGLDLSWAGKGWLFCLLLCMCVQVCVRCVCMCRCEKVRSCERPFHVCVLMRAERWVALSLPYTALTLDSRETERCFLTLIRLFDSKPWVVSNQWALRFSRLTLYCVDRFWMKDFSDCGTFIPTLILRKRLLFYGSERKYVMCEWNNPTYYLAAVQRDKTMIEWNTVGDAAPVFYTIYCFWI